MSQLGTHFGLRTQPVKAKQGSSHALPEHLPHRAGVCSSLGLAHAVTTVVTDPRGVLHYTVDTDLAYIDLSIDGGPVRRYIPGGSVPNRSGADGRTTYTVELHPDQALTLGEHSVELTLTDHAGNTSAAYTHQVTYIQPVDAQYVDDKIAGIQVPASSANTAAIDENRQGIATNAQGIAQNRQGIATNAQGIATNSMCLLPDVEAPQQTETQIDLFD